MRDGIGRLAQLKAKRAAEDDLQVCLERAQILAGAKSRHAHLSRTRRQAAILRDLCEQITLVIEPEDAIVGRMPEIVPSPDDERFIEQNPELFCEPGLPGWLDSLSIYIPDWDRLVGIGLGGIAAETQGYLASLDESDDDPGPRREFLESLIHALQSISMLIRRYAQATRDVSVDEPSSERSRELLEIAQRCERIAWGAAESFLDALQLMQIVHMVLSCLIGGRDVTPGRMDQYLFGLYRDDLERGRLDPEDAAQLLAMFFLRLSQMAGSGTDFDDNVRRTPCRYTHLYVTIGGLNAGGTPAINELSYVITDAIRLLSYREPTLLVRYQPGMASDFGLAVAGLIRDRLPVTVYNDDVVIPALMNQGVPIEDARGYAFSACHNVLVVGREAGSGPGGFHNVPRMLLLAMNGGRDPVSGEQSGAGTAPVTQIGSFEQLWEALRAQMRFALVATRNSWEARWRDHYEDSCPLLQSALMRFCLEKQEPCWRAAPVSHFNHHLMGLATTVDSLSAIRELVFEHSELSLDEMRGIVADDWSGEEALRKRIRARVPRYGQDSEEARQLAARLGEMWVEEVKRASEGMSRAQMWPGFYSHLSHVHVGKTTPATPDGRKNGEALSENQGPSYGTPDTSPTSILRAMAGLPFEQTPSGAATLTLPSTDVKGEAGAGRILSILETYFRSGGLHLQINALDPGMLEDAMERPENYPDLVVRVTGFSANFTRLSRDAQADLVRRYQRDVPGA